jgi:hypothetical protein
MTITEAKKQYPNIREKKVAYNFLFTDCHINGRTAEKINNSIDKFYQEKLKKFNIPMIKQYIANNYDNYKQKPFIANSYEEIDERIG